MILRTEIASRPRAGETFNGDAAVALSRSGRHLLALVDGLGHGEAAHLAASAALDHLHTWEPATPLVEVLGGLDRALRNTRGAAVAVCTVSEGTLRGASVGNVSVRATGFALPFVPTPGVVGAQHVTPRVFAAALPTTFRLCLFSDGVSARLTLEELAGVELATAASRMLRQFSHHHDDATLLLAEPGGAP
ncbi:MAG: hypothetical protein AB2A00_32405 [Myxococcota bacterium]